MKTYLTFLLLLPAIFLAGQPDDYTTGLIQNISVQYTLTGETFPYYDSEQDFVTQAGHYGFAHSTGTVDDQDFTQVVNIDVPAGLVNRWDAAWSLTNTEPVALGDKVLFVLWLRAVPDSTEDATGKVAVFIERNDTYDKEFDTTLDLTGNWRRYFIPVEIGLRDHPVGGLTFGIHVGFDEQVVQVGGLAVLNYGPDIPYDQLPRDLNTGTYGGFEEDAPWRAPAADRIDSLRKANMNFTVLDTDGTAMAETDVAVRMQRHAFKFGTAVKGSRFPGGREYNETFMRNIFDLDGEGHGFNAVVFENDFKWPAWEQEWVTTNEQMRSTLDYLAERDIHMRGHVLVWPGWQNLPNRMQQNAGNPAYLKAQVDDHLVRMLDTENFDAKVTDWDVLNEVTTNTDLAAALAGTNGYTTGREIYAEIFKRADELAPDASLYVNDYVTLSLKNTPGTVLHDIYQDYVGDMIAQGAPIDGVGFQAHLSATPNSLYEVQTTLDDWYDRFGLEAKITEFDLPRGVDPNVGPKYLGDFLTMVFSHPSMTGFMFWNWWDVDTWANPGVNLYNEDWTETPAHAEFTRLVFDQWWTNETVRTDASGLASVRGFKGMYEIELTCGGEVVNTVIDVTEDANVTLDCAQLLVSTSRPALPEGSITVSPNPFTGPITVINDLPLPLTGQLFDGRGRRVWDGLIRHGSNHLPVHLPAGQYHLRVTDGNRSSSYKLIRQ